MTDNNYKLLIQILEVAPKENSFNNVIKKIHWSMHKVDGVFVGKVLGVVDLPPPSENIFIDYENITEAEAFSWLKQQIKEEELKQIVDQDIYNLKNPKMLQKIPPWIPGSNNILNPSDAVIDNSPQSLAQTLMQEYRDKVAEVKLMVDRGVRDLEEIKQQLEEIQTSQNNT